MHQGAGAGDAGLAGGGEDTGEQPGLGLPQVGVREDDVGALAAELQREMSEARGGPGPDCPAGLDAAGEGDLGDVRMVDQRLAGGAVAGDDIDHARRDADRLGEPRRLDHRSGRHLRRLDHHRVAGGERRGDRHRGEE